MRQDIWDANAELLTAEVLSIDPTVETINLVNITPFDWDVVYSFDPYTPKDQVYETVGYKWERINETVSEGMNQIVFMNNNKVVCYLYGYPDNNGYGLYFAGDGVNNVAQKLKTNDHLIFQVKRRDELIYLTNY